MATIKDVARRAGVSPTTAKRAIREPELLAKDTLARVRHAIDELGYVPDAVAGALRRGRTQTVGLIVGNVLEAFFARLSRTISKQLHQAGYSVLIADNEYRTDLELQALQMLHSQRAAGIILRSGYGASNLGYLQRLRANGTAIVEIDYHYPNSPFSWVMLDNAGAVVQGVKHLAALGHRRIAALGAYDPERNPEDRSLSFERALADVGLRPRAEYRRVITLTESEAYDLTRDLLALPEPPTAILSLTGNQGAGAYRAIREAGLTVPRDVSLVTFDNYSWTQLVEPQIDVIEQPVDDMALASIEILLDLMDRSGPAAEPARRVFPARLLVRGSSGPPPLD
ncbi:MAG: LacI family DNA-binding transcriptional regulator [Deinococcales bacterium]